METKLYDIIIIGAGPAGITAAIYAGRAGKSVLIIDKDGFGGNIALSPRVENIPGFVEVSGIDFMTQMFEQMSRLDCVTHIIDEIKLISYDHKMFKVYSDSSFYCGNSVIIASGSKHKALILDTPDVYYCATCDGPMFINKTVAVVGSGNSGAVYALELASYCKKVYLCDITAKMCCEEALQDRINKTSNIEWKPSCYISRVKNNKDGHLNAVIFSDNEMVKCSAIFAAIGLIPQTNFAATLTSRDANNYIIADNCECGVIPGLFAAGDCRSNTVRQVTTACGDGTVAAIKAIKFIN